MYHCTFFYCTLYTVQFIQVYMSYVQCILYSALIEQCTMSYRRGSLNIESERFHSHTHTAYIIHRTDVFDVDLGLRTCVSFAFRLHKCQLDLVRVQCRVCVGMQFLFFIAHCFSCFYQTHNFPPFTYFFQSINYNAIFFSGLQSLRRPTCCSQFGFCEHTKLFYIL